MGCAGCATKVQNALSKREGVTEAKVNFADSTVMIEYDTTLPPSALQKTVEETGYELIIENEENHPKNSSRKNTAASNDVLGELSYSLCPCSS